MSNIEDIIKQISKNDIKIPTRIDNRINYALKNKNKIIHKNYFKKFIISIISILCTLIGGLSVYAILGGTIEGKPVIKWLGFDFSNNYNEYIEPIENQQVNYNETTISLVSTVCDEGFTIFEFDVKVSNEDKEYLRLDKNVITEKDMEDLRKGYEDGNGTNAKREGYSFEETEGYKFFNANKDVKNTIQLEFKTPAENNEIKNIFIDGEGYYARYIQTTNKIADNEYRVYLLYLLTDEILKGKEEFEVKFKNLILENVADNKKEKNKGSYILANTQSNEKSINVDGEFTANVSKKKITENTKIIENTNNEIKYKKMTEKIEKISKTPIQIVIKISKVYNNISLQSLSNTRNKDYIGIEKYTVKDSNGNEIPVIDLETKRTITYSNGKKEEWSPGDIGTYIDFSNATLEIVEYLIIEQKNDVSDLKITTSVEDFTNMNENDIIPNWKDIGEFNISLSE